MITAPKESVPLIFFDGTYRLSRGNRAEASLMRSPAWRLRLIDLETGEPAVMHLRPIIVIATPDGDAPPFTTCAESLGRRICRDFDLDIRKVLWIEHRQHRRKTIQVATFTPLPGTGPVKRYAIRWRSIRQNELETVIPFIPDLQIP